MRAAAIAAAFVAATAGVPALRAQAQGVALVGATVHPVSGPTLEHATVLLKDGVIQGVGAGLPVPAGYVTVDARGKVVTPGLIHTSSNVGAGVGNDQGSTDAGDQDGDHTAVAGTSDDRKSGDINPSFNVADGLDPWAINIPVARLGGVTTALTLPGGRFIAGQGPIIDLFGMRVADMLVRRAGVLAIDLSTASRGAGGGSRAAAVQLLRRLFRDATVLAARKLEYEGARMRPLAAPAEELEALLPALRGTTPVFVRANRAADIETVLQLRREYPAMRLVLVDGTEAWVHAAALAAAGIPVALDTKADIPSFDGVRPRLDNAALLREAGVSVIVAGRDPGGEQNLRFNAGHAVRNGLPWADALRAVTLAPATALGIADRYGSLDKGKVANVVVWSGDPLDFASAAERVYIRGVDVPLTSRMTELRDRYRTLPPRF